MTLYTIFHGLDLVSLLTGCGVAVLALLLFTMFVFGLALMRAADDERFPAPVPDGIEQAREHATS